MEHTQIDFYFRLYVFELLFYLWTIWVTFFYIYKKNYYHYFNIYALCIHLSYSTHLSVCVPWFPLLSVCFQSFWVLFSSYLVYLFHFQLHLSLCKTWYTVTSISFHHTQLNSCSVLFVFFFNLFLHVSSISWPSWKPLTYPHLFLIPRKTQTAAFHNTFPRTLKPLECSPTVN